MSSLGQLEKLTDGERLFTIRRRKGWDQHEAAAHYKVSRSQYCRWELDRLQPQGLRLGVGRLKPHEKCVLYRRRAKTTQAAVAKELGICRWWLNQMERGQVSADTLLWYWEQ